jgi:hypothetical protein
LVARNFRLMHRGCLPPNNSFKPNLLRYTKAMAEKACHGFASTTQVGLTQALGRRGSMSHYFVHNGYAGSGYGTPSDPQLVSAEDAAKLMQSAGLSSDQVSHTVPAAQYAETGDKLFEATGGNRFLFLGDYMECADVNPDKVAAPLFIDWTAA